MTSCLARFPSPLFYGAARFPPVRVTVAKALSTTAPSADDVVIKTQQLPAPGSGSIRLLLLNRPQTRNALSRQLLDDLSTKVESIAAEHGSGPTRALVLASNVDSTFCAGADLKERVTMSPQECVFSLNRTTPFDIAI